jgi:hypothetical protein
MKINKTLKIILLVFGFIIFNTLFALQFINLSGEKNIDIENIEEITEEKNN